MRTFGCTSNCSGFCQLAIDLGAELLAVSMILGHKTTMTTETYDGRIRGDTAIREFNSLVTKDLEILADLKALNRSILDHFDERLGFIWNDPDESHLGFGYNNKRGGFHTFGKDVFDSFMFRNSLDLMIRAHEPWPDGYKYFFDKRLISVFSCAEHYKVKAKAVLVREDGPQEILPL